MASAGPLRCLQGHREPCGVHQPGWSQRRHGWMPLQGFCPAGLLANSVCGLLLWREQDQGQGPETAYRWPPAWPCRVCTSPTFHSLQGTSQLEGGRPPPLPKARSSSGHGKSRDPASSHCPGRCAHLPTAAALRPPWHTPRSLRWPLWKTCASSLPLERPLMAPC